MLYEVITKGISTVTYTSQGVDFTEELLASAPDDLIAIHIKASKKKSLNFTIKLEREQDAEMTATGNLILMNGQIHDKDDSIRGPGGDHMRFGARVEAINKGGNVSVEGKNLKIQDADESYNFV